MIVDEDMATRTRSGDALFAQRGKHLQTLASLRRSLLAGERVGSADAPISPVYLSFNACTA